MQTGLLGDNTDTNGPAAMDSDEVWESEAWMITRPCDDAQQWATPNGC
jgi:hypothetical protein